MLLRSFIVLGVLLCANFVAAQEMKRPNVVLIAIDDLNDWIGCLGGHPQAQTPHLDALAARGTLFLNAHCQAPLCNPSRTSFLTSLRPTTSGVYALQPWIRSAQQWEKVVTLPQAFRAAGYHTMSCGKVFHDAYPPPRERKDGNEFDTWGYHGGYGPFPAKKFVETPDAIKAMDWGVFPASDADQEDAKVADWAIAQLQEKQDRPFMLGVGLRRPHVPCFASQAWFDRYPLETLKLPRVLENDRHDVPDFAWKLHWKLPEPRLAWLNRANQWEKLVQSYLASVSFVDSQVGRVLKAIDSAGLRENTIVVVLSDHGWHLGEKGITGKNTLWERSTRVPFMFAGPNITAGGRCSQPAELLDLMPTLLEAIGAPPLAQCEGHSLVPQLRDAAAKREHPAITSQGPQNHSVRSERYRYIRYADGSEELYDHAADSHEETNLAGDRAFDAIKADHIRFLPQTSAAPLPGSIARLIELKEGVVYWETKAIAADALPPSE